MAICVAIVRYNCITLYDICSDQPRWFGFVMISGWVGIPANTWWRPYRLLSTPTNPNHEVTTGWSCFKLDKEQSASKVLSVAICSRVCWKLIVHGLHDLHPSKNVCWFSMFSWMKCHKFGWSFRLKSGTHIECLKPKKGNNMCHTGCLYHQFLDTSAPTGPYKRIFRGAPLNRKSLFSPSREVQTLECPHLHPNSRSNLKVWWGIRYPDEWDGECCTFVSCPSRLTPSKVVSEPKPYHDQRENDWSSLCNYNFL